MLKLLKQLLALSWLKDKHHKVSLYRKEDHIRVKDEISSNLEHEEYRSEFWRDYARILHSPSFRRLTGKTQLFPNNESDFFRNRLTHSLEVAQIAKSLAKRINHNYNLDIDEDLVSLAALAHDIGHPPFGHQGEEALDECMQFDGGFEGNAQTLRILSKIEKKIFDPECVLGIDKSGKDVRVGLNLTLRSLASILKYDNIIPDNKNDRIQYHKLKNEIIKPIKGIYNSEIELIKLIKKELTGIDSIIDFKTIECSIMDVADDIAYSIYDLEDAFKAGFLTPIDLLYPEPSLLKRVSVKLGIDADKVQNVLIKIYGGILDSTEDIDKIPISEDNKDQIIFFHTGSAYHTSKDMARNGAQRTQLTSKLVGKFIRAIKLDINKENPILSKAYLEEDSRIEVEILKTLTYESQILSPKLKVAELRGKEIVKKIFETILMEGNYQLLPKDYQEIYLNIEPSEQKRVICDFIAGMTNKYAIEFYGRLTSEDPETIFKPL